MRLQIRSRPRIDAVRLTAVHERSMRCCHHTQHMSGCTAGNCSSQSALNTPSPTRAGRSICCFSIAAFGRARSSGAKEIRTIACI